MNKNVAAHLKIWLLQGKRITHNQANKLWHTNRLAEFVRRLRNQGMKIKTNMVTDPDTGDRYGEYFLDELPKQNRIKTLQH